MSCINPITNLAYQIGDDGPGGGIIFSIPGQGNNSTNYYFEAAPVDVSTTQRAQVSTTLGATQTFDCTGIANAIPGAEFGVHKEIISPTDNGQSIGDGINNTTHLNSYPTSFGGTTSNPTNPVLDIHDLAAKLCVDYVDPSGTSDWFLPSLTEMTELASNLGPTSTFNNVTNIANLNTSTSHPASAFYWTSSVLAGPPGTVFDTIAAGVNVATGNPQIMDRCSTGSVRPVRMFECLSPSGIDYDYRINTARGYGQNGAVTWLAGKESGDPFYNNSSGVVPSQWKIGLDGLVMHLPDHDVRHNPVFSQPAVSSYGSFTPNYPNYINYQGLAFNIKVYSQDETLLGDWDYEVLGDLYNFSTGSIGMSPITYTCGWSQCAVTLYFSLVNTNYIHPTHNTTIQGETYINVEDMIGGVQQALYGNSIGNSPYQNETSAYIAITESSVTGGLTRGNTVNLENYLGLGIDMREHSGNVPDFSNWRWHCTKCNPFISVSPYSDCSMFMAEIPPIITNNNANYLSLYHDSSPYIGVPSQFSPSHILCMNTAPHCCESTLLQTMYAPPGPISGCIPVGSPPPQAKLPEVLKHMIFRDGRIDQGNNISIEAFYVKNDNQTVKIVEDQLDYDSCDRISLTEDENENQKILKFYGRILPNSTKNIFNITFKTNDGYYYSKSPSLTMNFPGSENYRIKVESESKNANGYVIEKTFNISYKNTGFDVFEADGHNIIFTNKITKEVVKSTEVKEITALQVNTSSVSSDGESRNISIVGTPGSTFSLTIKDKNGRNVLPYTNNITKTVKTIASASATLELSDAAALEVGMIVLNDQRRDVKITGISDPVKTNVDAISETSTTYITISSHLTFAVNDSVTFTKETDITEVVIPDSGTYSFTQRFPVLEKFKRTLKTVASGITSLNLDYNDDLEDNMKITGTGVDGNDPIISSNGVNADGVTVAVSDSQTIADETELTFEMPDNRYDITIQPLMALLSSDVLSTYSIYQYIDPIVQIAPLSALSNVTTTGTVTFTNKANTRTVGTTGDITINMVATKSDGTLIKSREPRFSSVDSTISDFSNTLNTITRTVREDVYNTTIAHLNNITGIRVGMVVTGESIDTNKTVTVKSIVGTTVKFSSRLTMQKDDKLTFSSMFNMSISGLTATLSDNGGLSNGICTIAGTGKIRTFGIDSFTSTFNFDNFLSV